MLVFTDLDGTLLDPVNYSFSAAMPALELLRAQGVALILCSSKTRAEMLLYRQRLGNGHPFIVENGAGVCVPRGYFATAADGIQTPEVCDLITLGTPHAEIRRQFEVLREQSGARVRGFTDMSVEEVAALTGLGAQEAALAKQREFDEPFVFDGPPDASFLQAIHALGLNWTEGRLYHILGPHDKGRAVRLLRSIYEREQGAVVTLGLGDGPNDLPMLHAVDYPVLVRHQDGDVQASLQMPGLTITHHAGPRGWNDAVLDFMSHEHA